jgi:hypothetical protein
MQQTEDVMYRLLLAAIGALAICMNATTAPAMEYKAFSDEFRDNPDAFKRKYIGQTVTVSGSVGLTRLGVSRSGPMDGPSIDLVDPGKEAVHCYLNDADKERALSIVKGAQVTITGTFLQANVSGLYVEPCSFQ